MFLKTEFIQRSRKDEIARLLIQAGVKSGPEFNKVASNLLALHIKGYDHTPTWPNGKYMRSCNTESGTAKITNDKNLLAEFNELKHRKLSKLNAAQILIREKGKELLKDSNTFVYNLKKKFMEQLKICKPSTKIV